MMLFCHILAGAAIAAKINIPLLAFSLAFLSHYILDCVPHWEYSIDNILSKQWKQSKKEFLKGGVDFLFGILLVFALVKNQPIVYIAVFFAILPDGLTLINLLFPNKFLTILGNFHKKTHWFKKEPFSKSKIIFISGILSQVLISILAVKILLC
jgi:hypothetical protein